jgi:hypothetical protein
MPDFVGAFHIVVYILMVDLFIGVTLISFMPRLKKSKLFVYYSWGLCCLMTVFAIFVIIYVLGLIITSLFPKISWPFW